MGLEKKQKELAKEIDPLKKNIDENEALVKELVSII